MDYQSIEDLEPWSDYIVTLTTENSSTHTVTWRARSDVDAIGLAMLGLGWTRCLSAECGNLRVEDVICNQETYNWQRAFRGGKPV